MIQRLAGLKARAAGLFELSFAGQRFVSMEGLRGFSALLVFFVHFDTLFGEYSKSATASAISAVLGKLGHCGVDVFFALSGFMIYGMLLKRPKGYGSFVKRRIIRLYPTFLTLLFIYICISVVMPSVSKFPQTLVAKAGYLLANVLMLPGIFPIEPIIVVAWSLSYELFFYLTLPLLMLGLRIYGWRRTARILFFAIGAAAFLGLHAAGYSWHPRMIMFGCGILLRETYDSRSVTGRAWEWAALSSFLVTLLAFGWRSRPLALTQSGMVLSASWVLTGALFLSVYALGYFTLGQDGLLAGIFSWDWLRWLGNMSYSYYLVHGLTLHALKRVLETVLVPASLPAPAFAALCMLCFAATLVASAMLFLGVEKRYSLKGALPPPAKRQAVQTGV